jgi:hypothetical protein
MNTGGGRTSAAAAAPSFRQSVFMGSGSDLRVVPE